MRTFVMFVMSLSIAGLNHAATRKAQMDVPQISCAGGTQVSRNITICAPAGGTGVPAGFSLQWMTCDAYAANGHQWFDSDDPQLAKASFSGNANSSRYDLAPGQCVTVNVGDLLLDQGASTNNSSSLSCGTCYVFRSFAHATSTLSRSDFTGDLTCATADCGGGDACTYTFSQWSTLGPPCDPGLDLLPLPAPSSLFTALTLGTVTYGDAQLTCILGVPASDNGLVALAHQLIAAKLNEAKNGSLPPNVATCVADADAIIGGLVVPPIGTGFLDWSATASLTTCLANYNEGAAGTSSCPPPDPGLD